MAQHPRLRPHFAAMLQNRRSAVPSCHAASSYYSATAMANESARRMRIDACPQPNCRQRRSTAEFELDHRRSSSLVKCAIIFSKTKETAMYQPGPWCQQQHGTARKIPVLTFAQHK
ncbi:uncharacterized protein LOC115238226 [Formica exsecta]|uniref:uncharacterized protein LOC115238226 n=1 Tax=Formica exsecta TaxID=72781 RepID=UPI0011430EE8|nr:uncharacterized protein LOC115238226 [Formica exsecta]